MPEPRFVSEEITPIAGAFAAGAMVRGEPGLPPGFRWRGAEHRIADRIEAGKKTRPSSGERYVHRHTFVLRMEDGAVWEVYVTRQPPIRWYLYRIRGEPANREG